MDTDTARLREILLEKSYQQGTFTLTSGRTSDFYIDGKQTTLDAEGAYLCGKLLHQLIRRRQSATVAAVGGMTLGADPLVTAVAVASFLVHDPMSAFIVRKEAKGHGTGQALEGVKHLPSGSRVALVEDVVTTGGTLLKVIDIVSRAGYVVDVVTTVVDREEGGAEALAARGCILAPLFTRTSLLA